MFGHNKDCFGAGLAKFGQKFSKSGLGPRFLRGDIKMVLLDLLRDKPRHGYDIIQELGKKFHGCYTPSSGTIYPTLQLLEDQDLLVSTQREGKKVYSLTEAGAKYLEDNQTEVAEMQCRISGSWGEKGELINEMKDNFTETAHLLIDRQNSGQLSSEQKDELKLLFKKLSDDVTRIISH
jgi:DNA-binding PadR family transcriptional regulator